MPTYEYRCEACNLVFSLHLSITEHDREKVSCPACRSDQVMQLFSPFYAKTSKKS